MQHESYQNNHQKHQSTKIQSPIANASCSNNELSAIKHELELLKRDIKTEREANRALFRKLLDSKSYAENLKKAIESYRKRYYDEKEKCQQLYIENTNQRKKIQELIKSQKTSLKIESCRNFDTIKLDEDIYKNRYEAEKQRNAMLNLVIQELEKTKVDTKTTLPGSSNKLDSVEQSPKQ